jgi:hypothetical protein
VPSQWGVRSMVGRQIPKLTTGVRFLHASLLSSVPPKEADKQPCARGTEKEAAMELLDIGKSTRLESEQVLEIGFGGSTPPNSSTAYAWNGSRPFFVSKPNRWRTSRQPGE